MRGYIQFELYHFLKNAIEWRGELASFAEPAECSHKPPLIHVAIS